MGRRFLEAREAFAATIEDLRWESEVPAEEQREIGERAALLAVAMHEWKAHLGPLLTAAQVKGLVGVSTRQAVSDLARRKRLLMLSERGDRRFFPAFQFGREGRPFPVMPRVLAQFEPAGVSAHTVASWFVSPQALLDKKTPATWLREGQDPGRVAEAARRSAARLAR